MTEGTNNLNIFIDLDEYKLYKTLLRLNGVKQEDIEPLAKEEIRKAANSAGGVKREVIERETDLPDDNKGFRGAPR